ncbi:MAG: TonB-dependent siderophore receptor [Bradyrhizobium sp.]|jgi:iron complex outermembrane receptor protein|uniref:TonB-dependent siderophore receptor n=2 Tax=Bradyrhizobium TaxID=374 RepID=A0ABS5G7K9_9BRAD|nr:MULTISPECIES: TonB-dependent siderophore receptor [Bradyrhizobium]MBR1137314.1 TonB-dependent siderophore receptor [Bradyrhizobium denitrificans]MDU1491469.1 TonB-dependent siderophore receptor [Bradyrhizobium sp.]MDU1541647.1 TonB-dependent siderophore receptor [Bradyrhizobium sp.]MDU2923237.1 TonB-dependent siderophore receptor [Bradyrhizobium sp.]MDU3041289.1 TonB-dependent siderophore receptor [Bradyrhizobium sp.]
MMDDEGRRDARARTGMCGAIALVSALTADLVCSSSLHAQATLPAVTVDAPAPKRKPATSSSAPQRQARATPSRRTMQPPPMPTRAERAAAEAVVLNAAKLNYRAMPSATTLRSGASPLDTAQSVNVVPEQVIRDQLPRNIDDALANVSGVTQANTLAGTQDAVMRRGFGDNRDGSIMRNGMPLVQGRSLNAAVESVEVLKGPASLLYGIMDPGGIVNTISKRPELYQHGSVTLLGSAYANDRTGADGTIDVTGPIGDGGLAYRFIGYGVSEDYWRNFGRHREMLVAPSLAWYGDMTTVQLNYEHREFITPFDRGTAFVNGAPLAIPATRRLDEPFNNMWGQSDLVQASVEQKLNDDWKLTAAYSYNTETFSANQLRITAINATTGLETRSNDGTWGSLSRVSYGTSYVQGSFWLGGLRNEVLFGGDAQYRTIYRQDLIRQTVSTPFNIYNPVYGLVQPGTTISATDSEQTDKLGQYSLFLQDTLHLTDRLALIGGVRYMDYEQIAGRGRPFKANTNVAADKVLPLGGAILKLNDQLSLYASYTQSLKPNSTIAPLTGGVVLGSNIAPEQGTSWETGVKFDLDKRLSGTIAVYDIDKSNVLVSQLNASNVLEYTTAGKVRSRGAEVDVTGRLTQAWSMIGSYGYTDARVTDDPTYRGKRLQNVALNTASLYLVYDFGAAVPGKLRLGGGARYVGDRAGDAANSFVMPSYVVADLFATYETKHQNLPVIYQLNVKNLFDNVYYPSANSVLNVAVGDARRVSLAATVKF